MEERQTQGVAIALDTAGNLYVSAERVGGAVSAEFVLKIDVSRMVSAQQVGKKASDGSEVS
jgi:hypothetical protein